MKNEHLSERIDVPMSPSDRKKIIQAAQAEQRPTAQWARLTLLAHADTVLGSHKR